MNQIYRPGSSEYLKLLGYKRYHYLSWPQVSSTRLVLLHGRGESADIWTGFANQFVRHADTIAVDLRGHGGTPWDPDLAYAFDDFVDDLRLQLEHWRRKSILIANGLGGRVAIATAAHLPDLIEALVLIETDIESESSESLVANIASNLAAGSIHGQTQAGGVNWDGLYHSLTWARPGGDRSPKCDPAVLEANESSPLWEQTASLTQPVLMLRGAGADRGSPRDEERIRDAIPQVQFAYTERSGWPHIEDPSGVAKTAMEFLEKIGSNG